MTSNSATSTKKWPLEGIKVLDLGQIYNGPYAGFLLAHAGADVVKVEPLSGEVLRERGGGEVPLSFAMLNTNKRGITINLKESKGKELLLELAGDATLDAVNYDRRAAINRFLIYRDQILEDYFYILKSIASR